jgi:diaminohydroxyphosphoribosylaminopyrimidine deaminase/5-amino-6-(5-phosphoribosylamino)uracil reductase
MGNLDWSAILDSLWNAGIYSVLIEGGARVAGSALQAGIVHKVAWFVAPKLMGHGRTLELPVRGAMSEIETLRDVRSRNLDGDVLIEGYFANTAFEWL